MEGCCRNSGEIGGILGGGHADIEANGNGTLDFASSSKHAGGGSSKWLESP